VGQIHVSSSSIYLKLPGMERSRGWSAWYSGRLSVGECALFKSLFVSLKIDSVLVLVIVRIWFVLNDYVNGLGVRILRLIGVLI